MKEFLRPARSRRDLFDADLISAIFCNVEKLRGAHQTFLSDLELSLTWKPVCIGPSFLKHVNHFTFSKSYFYDIRIRRIGKFFFRSRRALSKFIPIIAIITKEVAKD